MFDRKKKNLPPKIEEKKVPGPKDQPKPLVVACNCIKGRLEQRKKDIKCNYCGGIVG